MIACEDSKTEPAYFEYFKKQFPKESLYIEIVGVGEAPKNVIERAIVERKRFKEEHEKEIDYVWAVFDKDDADLNDTTIRNFNDAFHTAARENINVAYSNEVFELWLLLHFQDVEKEFPIPRKEIYGKLEDCIRRLTGYEDFVYQHGKPSIIDITLSHGDEKEAIARAKNLMLYHENRDPIKANPSTKMYELIEKLREWIKYYNFDPEQQVSV